MRKLLLILMAGLLLASCSKDDAYTTYSRYKASFAYYLVLTTTPLKNALTGPGEFCSIRLTTDKQLLFVSPTMSQKVDVTAAASYQSFICLSGFIVGYANMPEMNMDGLSIVCFDLACPNCYADYSFRLNLALKEGGYAYCSKCGRKYNLNSQGLVCGGDAGRPLERYHIAYNGANNMVISN